MSSRMTFSNRNEPISVQCFGIPPSSVHCAACKERIILFHLKLAERINGQCGAQDTRDHFANSPDLMLRQSDILVCMAGRLAVAT